MLIINCKKPTEQNRVCDQTCALPGTMSLDDLEEEEMEDTEEAPSPCSTSTTIKRPRMSYAQLIAEALMNSDTRRLTLNDIYVHINSRSGHYFNFLLFVKNHSFSWRANQ